MQNKKYLDLSDKKFMDNFDYESFWRMNFFEFTGILMMILIFIFIHFLGGGVIAVILEYLGFNLSWLFKINALVAILIISYFGLIAKSIYLALRKTTHS